MDGDGKEVGEVIDSTSTHPPNLAGWFSTPRSCWKLNSNTAWDLDMHSGGLGWVIRNHL